MSQRISLREAERQVFRTAYDDGLWDLLLGCVFLMFAVGPYLSHSLGDFWSSAVFLPFWALVYLAIRLIRSKVLAPRIGLVKLGSGRRTRLARFAVVMIVINVVVLILGLAAAIGLPGLPGRIYTAIFGLSLLIFFSIAAFFLDINRLYLYGLLAALSPLIGELLWAQGYAPHHGFPVTFGATSGIMILVGLVVFVRLLRHNPLPVERA